MGENELPNLRLAKKSYFSLAKKTALLKIQAPKLANFLVFFEGFGLKEGRL
jgi:hypothetical protein